eukprot:TRINITY_DN184_c1_g2_i1.p1 TRINITY_DN184_c1_g2~~TRINITY_DN184_c1_g2_i1.p1  ORF type:complete len:498 (+),score=87.49 TRINITY_DN184_c1_g2_i1:44-1537(+)
MSGTRNVVVRGLRYSQNGRVRDVLQKEEWVTPFNRSASDVVVKMIASPVHAHDKWTIQGRGGQLVSSPTKANPTVAGSEGVGVIEEAGSGCTHVKVGDHVVFNKQNIGTWADRVVTSEASIDKVPSDLQPEDLSMMTAYGTAYQLVNKYQNIKPDDVVWVLGSGAVGSAAACLLQQKGAKVFLIMRGGRPNEVAVHQYFRSHLPSCATIKTNVLKTKLMTTLTSDVPKPKLIINGMGGEALQEAVTYAAEGCKVVSYGNMSRKPLKISVGRHIFQDVQLLSFWYGKYLAESTREEREAMYAELADLFRTGAHANTFGSEWHTRARLFIRGERYSFEEHHKAAIENSGLLFKDRKPILRFDNPENWTFSGEWHKENEYFLDKEKQYLRNMGFAQDERTDNEKSSYTYGGSKGHSEFNKLWETETSAEVRKTMQPMNFRNDYNETMHDTYARYLETQGAMYGLDMYFDSIKKHPFDHQFVKDARFFPDDDPQIAEHLTD